MIYLLLPIFYVVLTIHYAHPENYSALVLTVFYVVLTIPATLTGIITRIKKLRTYSRSSACNVVFIYSRAPAIPSLRQVRVQKY